jgi:hypothetical protein
MADLPAGLATFLVGREGYEAASASVQVSGDTRLDVRLVKRRPVPASVSVSGIVYEQVGADRAPLAGAVVENSYSHTSTTTDALGRYRLEFTPAELGNTDGFARIYATREGFVPSFREIVVEGDTRLDIELVRR